MSYKEEALAYLGITRWHELGYTGKGIKIMSDEKVCEKKHPDVISPKGFNSKSGHGDDVMAHIKLIAPDATYISYPFSGSFGNDAYNCNCADYIKNQGVHVFTTSKIGSYPNSGKRKAIQDCIETGCIFFAAAGNDGNKGLKPESCYEGYISIGGVKPLYNVTAEKYEWDKISKVNYSSVGKELDYVCIAEIMSVPGTSFCAPIFASMCGLVQQFFIERIGRSLKRTELEMFIKDNLIDVDIEGFDYRTGHGLFILPEPTTIDVKKYVSDIDVVYPDENIYYGGIPQVEEIKIKQMLLTPSEYTRPQTKIKPTAIAWHYVGNAGTSALANRNYFESLKDSHLTKASAHYIIGLEGEIIQCIPDDEMSYCTNQANIYTISVECCHTNWDGEFTEETYKSMLWLGKYLMKKHGIKENIRHYDVTLKHCPKWFVDHPEEWEKFKNKLEEEVMLENLIDKYGADKVEKALDTLIKQQTDNENVSDWADDVFKKVTTKNEGGKAIIEGNGNGEFDWQQPVSLERLMVILDKLNLLNGGK